MKIIGTWIYSASHFASVDGVQGNGNPQRPIRAKKDIYCLDMAEFIERVCALRKIVPQSVPPRQPILCSNNYNIQLAHVPQFIAYTNFPLGLTSEQKVEAQHSCYDAVYHRYRTSSVER